MAAVRLLISSKVQGVRFRARARDQALRLRLSGHAFDQEDGRVEVLAQGEAGAVEALAAWLRYGPSAARVDEATRSDCKEQAIAGFAVG
jgi:acylphosphatase